MNDEIKADNENKNIGSDATDEDKKWMIKATGALLFICIGLFVLLALNTRYSQITSGEVYDKKI